MYQQAWLYLLGVENSEAAVAVMAALGAGRATYMHAIEQARADKLGKCNVALIALVAAERQLSEAVNVCAQTRAHTCYMQILA